MFQAGRSRVLFGNMPMRFNWPNCCNSNIYIGSFQDLKETSTMKLTWGKGRPMSKDPRPLAQCHFRAVQCRRCRHNALCVFKWMCVQNSRVVPVWFIIVSSPLLEQAIVLHWTVMAEDLFPLHTDPHAYSCVECGRCKTWRGKGRE
jgi:hypothetical protein